MRILLSTTLLASLWGALTLAPLPVRQAEAQTGRAGTCVTAECHAGVLAGAALHAPVAQRKCSACHTLVDEVDHAFRLSRPTRDLCVSCHVVSHRTYVHTPVASADCAACHDPHGSDHRFHLRADPTSDLCFRCHDAADYTGKQHLHGPVEAGACIACHEAHSSWNLNLLTEPVERLCDACHSEVTAELEYARHTHEPLRQGRCLECHDVHGSDQPHQLLQAPSQLCVSCHEHQAVLDQVQQAARVHGALETESSCLSCHDGHASMMPALLSRSPLDLCLGCHDRGILTPEGRQLTDMQALLATNPNQHGPVRRADCSACHDPHAADYTSLLAQEYPREFYAGFELESYALCFSCHRTELVLQERGVESTDFRSGETNLHYLHVNKERQGRTCRACHEVHASRRPFHIRETVPFGGWMLEINFEQLPNGGRCAPGCHEPKSYRRGVQTPAANGTRGEET